MKNDIRNSVSEAAGIIKKHGMVCALTGAGISVESGIPPFRGAGGIWEKLDPFEYAHINTFMKNPAKVWDVLLRELKKTLDTAKPNPGHKALAELEKSGFLRTIITQNIDGLHQAAGNTDVIEFHGSFASLSCLDCGKHFRLSETSLNIIPPECPCGGILRPDCVFFGEMIPGEAMTRAHETAESTPVMLVIGTSANVTPAASIPVVAKRAGARIIEVNPEKTGLTDTISDVFIQAGAGMAMPELVETLRKMG